MAAIIVRALALAVLSLSAATAEAQTQVAVSGQTVTTGSQARQILFRDKTSLTAGPGASIKLSRANYDEATGAGNVVIDVAKGAFRYVTGNTNGTHTIRTPLATVGVRGTVIEGYVSPGGHEAFTLIEGAFQVCTRAMCRDLPKPGTYVVVSTGLTITPPAPVPAGLLASLVTTSAGPNLVQEHLSSRIEGVTAQSTATVSTTSSVSSAPTASGGGRGKGLGKGMGKGRNKKKGRS